MTAHAMTALPAEPVYLPFEAGPHRMAMGLVARDLSSMIAPDARYLAEMALRRQLLDERHGEVFATTAGSAAACAEVLATIGALLPKAFPDWFTRHGDVLHNRLTGEHCNLADPGCDPLEAAGRLVQEDLCVIQPDEAGPILAAAVLCFPSRWRLLEKIGHPLAVVHADVPHYAERLSRPVDRFMTQLRDGRLVERLNWSVIDDATLFQPSGKWRGGVNPGITAQNAGDVLVLRVERQTLSRLAVSGAVLFTIRVHVYPLARIAVQSEVAARLADAVRNLPEAMQHYKSLLPFRAALLEYLDLRAAA